MTRTQLFEAIRPFASDGRFSFEHVTAIDALADDLGLPRTDGDPLTVKICGELVGHEAIVQEMYLDSVGVQTWSVGITKASGISVAQYKDNPQPLHVCLGAYVDRLRKVYLPDVLKAFAGRDLTEAQLAAALSFHYNTGAIGSTSWVKLWLAGDAKGARTFLETHYLNNGTLTARRKAEAALFFDSKWSHADGIASVIPVSKPSYQPSFRNAKRVDIRADLAKALAA